MKNEKDLGTDCHTQPLKNAQKQGKVPVCILTPIPSIKGEFRDGTMRVPVHVQVCVVRDPDTNCYGSSISIVHTVNHDGRSGQSSLFCEDVPVKNI